MKTTVSGASLHSTVHGRGEPVLFVHAFPLSGAMWEPLTPHLSDRCRLILPDLRGFGQSGASETADMERYADDLVAVLDEIGERRPVVVVGLSMGGYIAFEFLRRRRERTRALVLADTRATPDTPDGAQERERMAQAALKRGGRVVAEAMGPKLFAPGTPAEVRQRWTEVMAATPPEGIAAALRAMARRPDSTPLLGKIDVPTLVIVGDQDEVTPPDAARSMHGAIPGARLEVIPGAGHLTAIERPEAFAALVRSFLDGLPPLEG